MNKFSRFFSLALALVSASIAHATVLIGITQPTSVPFNNPTLTTFTIPALNPNNYVVRGDGSLVSGSDLTALFSASVGTTGTGSYVLQTSPTIVFPNGLNNRFINNSSTAVQTPVAATRTYIAGSAIQCTAGTIQVGTVFRWHFDMTKTAAGSATSTFDIAFGTAGTTADTAQVSFTKPAGTAAIDEAWVDIECVVKTIGASGVAVGEFRLIHNLSATGHAQIPCVVVNTTSSTFTTLTPTFIGICITTGASDAITISQVSAESVNL